MPTVPSYPDARNAIRAYLQLCRRDPVIYEILKTFKGESGANVTVKLSDAITALAQRYSIEGLDIQGDNHIPAVQSFVNKATKGPSATHQNDNCDGSGPHTPGEVRVLPHTANPHHGNSILCRTCYIREIAYRKDRNLSLGIDLQYACPTWDTLEVYSPGT